MCWFFLPSSLHDLLQILSFSLSLTLYDMHSLGLPFHFGMEAQMATTKLCSRVYVYVGKEGARTGASFGD